MKNKADICLNCSFKLDLNVKFCPSCGSKATFNDLSIKSLFRSFFDTFLNIEYKILRSFRDIWRPNKITKAYVSGDRATYVHPFRFFFICLVIFFSLAALALNKADEDSEIHAAEKAGEFAMYQKYDSLKVNYASLCTSSALDSLQKEVFPKSFETKSDALNNSFFGVDFRKTGISRNDLYHLNDKELMDKYEAHYRKSNDGQKMSTWHSFRVRQGIKIQKHPMAYLKFAVKNLLWGVILVTIVIAGWIKLIYIRHKSYYAEHLVQVINFHCLVALISSIIMLFYLITEFDFSPFIGFILLFSPIFLFFSLKMYYNEHFLKTFIKVSFICFLYLFTILGNGVLIFLLSLIIFNQNVNYFKDD